MVVNALAKTHVALSVLAMCGAATNYFILNKSLSWFLACVTVPATLPIFPLTAFRFRQLSTGKRVFVLSLVAGGCANLFLAIRTLRDSGSVSLAGAPSFKVPMGRIRLETALVVSTLGATLLNGRRFVPWFGIQDTQFGTVWRWFSERPALSMAIVESVGAAMVLYDNKRGL